jgi:hypothetical protein
MTAEKQPRAKLTLYQGCYGGRRRALRKFARVDRVRGVSVEQPSFGVIMLATIIIGFWSLMSGTVLVMGLSALGIDLGIEPLRLFLGHSP